MAGIGHASEPYVAPATRALGPRRSCVATVRPSPFVPSFETSPRLAIRDRAEVGYEYWGGGSTVVPVVPRSTGEPAWQAGPAREANDATSAARRAVSPIAGAASESDEPSLRVRAAESLEGIALRVRAGEIDPLGLTTGMSDAAALAAVLAALLARRG